MTTSLLAIGTAVAEDVKNDVYAKFTDAYNMAQGIASGKYTLAEGLSMLDPGSTESWKKYFLSISDNTIGKWNAVAIQYDAFLKNRQQLGIPPFDSDSEVLQEPSVSSPSWTQEDDAYLRGVHNIVVKIAKYREDVRKGVRTIAWDSFNQDAVALGVEGEPTIATGKQGTAPVAYNPNNGDLLLSNFVKGQDNVLNPDFVSGAKVGVSADPITIGGLIVAGLLIVCVSVAAVLMINKICDTLREHLARAEAADIRKQQNKVIDGCSENCPAGDRACYDNCLSKAVSITKATADAVKTQEEARAAAAKASDTQALYSTVKTISLVALGIVAIGGAGYAIYRFAGPRPRQISENRYPALPQGNRMIDAEVVSSRNVGEPGPRYIRADRVKIGDEIQLGKFNLKVAKIKETSLGGLQFHNAGETFSVSYEPDEMLSIAEPAPRSGREYTLEVIYPSEYYSIDGEIEKIVGRYSSGSGMGPEGRDMVWRFNSKSKADSIKNKLSKSNLPISKITVRSDSSMMSPREVAMYSDKYGEAYVEYDEELGWCVFGSESGFCYATPATEKEAKVYERDLNKQLRSFMNVGEPSYKNVERWVKNNVNDYMYADGNVNLGKLLFSFYDEFDVDAQDYDEFEDEIYRILTDDLNLPVLNS